MKAEKKHSVFSAISLSVVAVYCLINSLFMCEWFFTKGTLSVFANIVFSIDLFTWHIYGLFATISLFIKVSKKSSTKRNCFLHLILMLISFFEIYWMIQNAF